MASAEAANSFYRSYDNPSRSYRSSSRLTHVLKWCHSPINAQSQQLWYQKPAPDNWLRFCRKHLRTWTSFHKLCSFFWAPCEWGCQTCRNYTPRKIRVDFKKSKPKNSTLSKDKLNDRPAWVCHFCGKSKHIHPNCFKLQATKWANKSKVLVPQAQDFMVLIGELVKALNLYSNHGVGHHSNVNNNSNARVASKKFWMQNAQSNCVFLRWSLCLITLLFVTILLCCFFFLCCIA